jgi:hypothetical protein
MGEPGAPPGSVTPVEAMRRSLGMTRRKIWVGYFALGGNAPLDQVERWLEGHEDPPVGDYDLLVHAVNEEAMDRGLDHPMPYSTG